MKLLTSLALASAGVSATTVNDKCLICSHVGFADSEENAIKGKRLKIIDIEHKCFSTNLTRQFYKRWVTTRTVRVLPQDDFGFDFSYQ